MAAANEFLRASFRLIGRRRPADEWSEIERLGMRVATRLQMAFQFVPDDYYVRVLAKALDAFDGQPSHKITQAWCVRTIAEAGIRWQQPEWQENERTRRFLLRQLVDALAVNDQSFLRLEAKQGGRELSPDWENYLAEQLDRFDVAAKGKQGRKSAEMILAEVIVRLGPGLPLWFKRQPKEDRKSMEDRIRGRLATAVDEYLGRGDPKKKRTRKKTKARKSPMK